MTWDELLSYARANYEHQEPGDGYIFISFPNPDGSYGMASLSRIRHPIGTEWMEICAPVGNVGEVDVNAAINAVGSHPCGGLSVAADMVMVRHVVPIASMSDLEFEVHRTTVTTAARALSAIAQA